MKKPSWKKYLKRTLWIFLIVFVMMNLVAYMHAYRFTHFNQSGIKTKTEKLSFGQKLSVVFFGIDNPRPENTSQPEVPFETIFIENKKLECWMLRSEKSKGTIILFHGYAAAKSSLLEQSEIFREQGYNTMLVDFAGSGGSEGSSTTIGYSEAEQVKSCFDYIKNKGEKNIVLYGNSMGAVSIMKAINDHQLTVQSVILECPFATLKRTVQNRFRIMGLPVFPMSNLLVFWGGLINGYNGFSHNPAEYAKGIHCPVLLLHGLKDERVTREETDLIYENLAGKKQLVYFPEAGHENYLDQYRDEWTKNIRNFLDSHN
jgi:uncharacterized protein